MLKYIIFTIGILTCSSFNLLQHYIPTTPTKIFYVEDSLRDLTQETFEYLNKYHIHKFHFSQHTGSTQPIQNNLNTITLDRNDNFYYGYTKLYGTNETDILINRKLLKTPTTLYNVLLHELVHSIGLNHTLVPSIQNYSIFMDERNNVIEDRRKMYLSLDDIRGMRYIKKTMKCIQ